LDGWSRAPAIVAFVLLWAAWLAGVIALLAPRPWGFAVLRVVAPVAVVLAAFADAPASTRFVALAGAFIAATVVLSAPIARACANSISYGDEDRYPLTVPVTLAAAPIPIAVALVAGGISLGPLLLADGSIVAGVAAVVVGFPLAFLAWRSLYALSRRWLVYVPAGVVVVDPLTLTDPLLMPRETIGVVTTRTDIPALDLRLGSARDPVTIVLQEAVPVAHRRGRAGAELVGTGAVRVGVVDRKAFLANAPRRRVPV
jgi:hypothetical protein